MSILNAIKETKHSQDNILELAKLPQALIMQMAQRGDIPKDMVMPILGKKAEMAESTARMRAAEQLNAQGGAQPTVMEKYMGEIAQAENPTPQLPEEVGIAQNPVPPMQMAGGGIIAFDDGGDVDVDPEDDYQDLIDQAKEDEINDEIFGIIASMGKDGGYGITAGHRGAERGIEDKGDMADRLRAQIMSKESGGRRYDKEGKLLTSSKGALGEMQVMPHTARDPGFGIKAARNNSPEELRRVGDEYAGVLLNRYGDPKLAMIAYNMGPGATDKWLASGADVRKLPKETQNYISGVRLAQGGEVKHYAAGDYIPFGEEVPYDESQSWGLKDWWKRHTLGSKENIKAQEEEKKKAAAPKPVAVPPPVIEAPVVVQPEAKPPTEAQQKADEETFNLMKYIKERQAKQDKLAEKDKWQAGLAAGLGMLGGTSQYAWENIGKGGQLGVQQLANLQKLRASQDIASDKLLGTAYNAEMLNKFRGEQLAQQGPMRYAAELDKVRQGRLALEEKYLKQPKYLSLATIDSVRDRLSKDPNNKELQTQYNNLMNLERDLRSRIKKEYPDPNPAHYGVKGSSGVIKLD